MGSWATRRWTPALAALLVVVCAALVAVAVLGRRDERPQPWQVLPATVAAFVAVDLDPAWAQKKEALALARAGGKASTREAALTALLAPLDVPGTAVTGWAGDRAAAAVAVGVAGSAVATPIAVVAVKDAAKMRAALTDLVADRGTDQMGYADAGAGYVLIAPSQDAASALVADATARPLLTDAQADLAVLDTNRVATVWADLPRLTQAVTTAPDGSILPHLQRIPGLIGPHTTGRVVAGARLDAGALAIDATARNWQVAGRPALPRATGTTALATLPANVIAGVAGAGLGEHLAGLYQALPAADRDRWDAQLGELGITLPGDLRAVFGTDAALGLTGTDPFPGVVARSTSPDPVAGFRAVQAYAQQVIGPTRGLELGAALNGSDIVTASSPQLLEAVTGRGDLGRSSRYQAVLDDDPAALRAYADLPALASNVGADKAPWRTLGPVGLTVAPADAQGSASLTVRLSLR